MSLTLNIPSRQPGPPTPTPSSTTLGVSEPSAASNKGKAPEHSTPIITTPRTDSSSPTSSTRRPRNSASPSLSESEETAWGSNFWVTLVDPQTQTSFFACPATGQVSWDPPVGNFVLPPSADGEWWELCDESRGGIPYYYQTKTGETVWERPAGFVIPLGIIQNTALARRLSQTNGQPPQTKRTRGQENEEERTSYDGQQTRSSSQSNRTSPSSKHPPPARRPYTKEFLQNDMHINTKRYAHGQLTPIPGSPFVTDASTPPSPASRNPPRDDTSNDKSLSSSTGSKGKESANGASQHSTTNGLNSDSVGRARARSAGYVSHKPQQPQSLNAVVEMLSSSQSDGSRGSLQRSTTSGSGSTTQSGRKVRLVTPTDTPTTPTTPSVTTSSPPRSPPSPSPRLVPTVNGKQISSPILNHAATLEMSPVKNRAAGQPIPVEPRIQPSNPQPNPTATLASGTFPILPHDLAVDIQNFSESDYARQYFSTHRTGFIFRRKVPVNQMMTWQKAPLTLPLLALNKVLVRDAVRIFKVIQHIMGDREREKPVAGVRLQTDSHVSMVNSINTSTTSLGSGNLVSILEEERWLLSEGLSHGELRDEIYCQLMKQLTGNPSTESTFKGWQLMCVLLITFPPSKNFETYLQSFMQQRVGQQEGRVDVMAKYCLRRLGYITKKGPRGKPPTIAEIETASDAAFNPSTFGESLDAIMRLQEREYRHLRVPIILPFLADGILALGGPRAEGIFRVPGDADSVSELKLRIDRGYYTLDSVDDPHVLASLMKLWLRELCDPLVPEEMYNECITNYQDPEACVRIVEKLPTVNRRVVLFVISFLQLFLEERTQSITKMTPANLALVMAPNLLRCASDSMSVVFTNAQYEQIFVYNLLIHLKCNEVDAQYAPAHGLGAVPPVPAPRASKSRSRRPQH
ncbi:hypothetical protein AX16_010635 [Volvariella volvacea WC 439]|nr:hypothetical protein AX16_010635 [Volvariella volvacea WC 439]